MANIHDKQELLLQNLQDAGLEEQQIERCLNQTKENNLQILLPFLMKHRSKLLQNIHEEQDKLDSLDYLIYQIKK